MYDSVNGLLRKTIGVTEGDGERESYESTGVQHCPLLLE